MDDKRWYESSTIQRNIVAAAIAVASAALLYADAFGFSAQTTAFIGFGSTVVVSIGNIWQRFQTKTGVK